MIIYKLRYGDNREVLATVLQDQKYSQMWRIRWPDGETSDMVNLSRAKDAAEVLCQRRHRDQRQPERYHWSHLKGLGETAGGTAEALK